MLIREDELREMATRVFMEGLSESARAQLLQQAISELLEPRAVSPSQRRQSIGEMYTSALYSVVRQEVHTLVKNDSGVQEAIQRVVTRGIAQFIEQSQDRIASKIAEVLEEALDRM